MLKAGHCKQAAKAGRMGTMPRAGYYRQEAVTVVAYMADILAF